MRESIITYLAGDSDLLSSLGHFDGVVGSLDVDLEKGRCGRLRGRIFDSSAAYFLAWCVSQGVAREFSGS